MTGGKVEQSWRPVPYFGRVELIRNHPSSSLAGKHQMAQLLHHQDSAFYAGKELHGCRWGILQFFGFRRLRSTKMLSDKKHGQGKSSGGKFSSPSLFDTVLVKWTWILAVQLRIHVFEAVYVWSSRQPVHIMMQCKYNWLLLHFWIFQYWYLFFIMWT